MKLIFRTYSNPTAHSFGHTSASAIRNVMSCDNPVCQTAFSTTGRYVGVLQNSAVKFEVDTAAVTRRHVPVNKIVCQVPG